MSVALRSRRVDEQRVQRTYNAIASVYDARWNAYTAATHAVTLELLDPQPGDHILDASGGTGTLTERLLDCVGPQGSVTITDISTGMLTQARKRLGGYSNVTFVQADLCTLDAGEERFSKVVCANAFHHYYDPRRALTTIAKTLRPGGTVMITDWRADLPFRLWEWYQRQRGKAEGTTYTMAEMREMLVERAFQIGEERKWRFGWYPLFSIKAIKGTQETNKTNRYAYRGIAIRKELGKGIRRYRSWWNTK